MINIRLKFKRFKKSIVNSRVTVSSHRYSQNYPQFLWMDEVAMVNATVGRMSEA